MIDLKKLVEAGVHFGHKTSRWHPKMAPYIWGFRNNIHLIDVSKTAMQLEKAAQFLEQTAAEGKAVLWIGTKKAAQDIVATAGQGLSYPYVIHRWIGGLLTNFSQVKKSITKLLHLEDIIKKSDQLHYTKKELVTLQKTTDRLRKNIGSVRGIAWPIGAVVVVDVKKEQTALREAATMGIPVVGFVDTNSDPSLVDYVVPTNDDAPKAIQIIMDYLVEAVKRGQQKAKVKPVAVAQAIAAEEMIAQAPLLAETEEDVVAGEGSDDKSGAKKVKREAPVVEKPVKREFSSSRAPKKK